MTKLKLVGADRYVCEKAHNEVMVRGQVIEVTDEAVKEMLLADVRTDELNNQHAMFVEVTDADLAADARRAAARAKAEAALVDGAFAETDGEGEGEGDADAPHAKAAARRRAK